MGLLILEGVRDSTSPYHDLLNLTRDYLLSLVEEGRGKPVAKKFSPDTQIYGKNFVAMTLAHVGDFPSETFHENILPAKTDWLLGFKDVALTRKSATPNAKWESGAAAAERSTERAYSAWLYGLAQRPNRPERNGLTLVEILDVDAGDRDRLGNAFLDLNNPDTQLLWALLARIRVHYVD